MAVFIRTGLLIAIVIFNHSANAQGAPEPNRAPRTLAGWCAKAVGGKWDGIRMVWATKEEYDPKWLKCYNAQGAGYRVRGAGWGGSRR